MAKKKYSVNWEDDTPVSYEVNGVQYDNLDDVPNEADRRKLEAMANSAEDAEFDAEFDAEMEQARKELEQIDKVPVEKIVLGVFTGVAVLMLLIAGIASYRNIVQVNREESVPGVVVDMTVRPDYADDNSNEVVGEIHFPVVSFTAKDGKRHNNVQLSEGSFPPSYEVGDEVMVRYDPDKPLDARIDSAGSTALMWVLPAITGVLGLGFLVAVIAVGRLMRTDETTPA